MKFAVMIPTYNERKSIAELLPELALLDLDILVIDDNSPDKTADFVKSLNYKNVDILQRPNKDGLGNAYKAGIKYLLSKNMYTHLISMDADGSHRVEDLQKLIAVAKQKPNSDLILGSRWIPGGAIENWPNTRKWLSKAGTWYAKLALKLKVNDLTGGFRIYPAKTLNQINFDRITSNGYCYQIEMALAISQLNGEIVEVPIKFIEREMGVSKMSNRIVLEAMAQITRWGLALRITPNADKLHYVK